METAEIVKIAVSAAPYSIDKPYDYLVPDALLEAALPGVSVDLRHAADGLSLIHI